MPDRPRRQPNIVVILVDDMGYSDIGCYGSEIHTPNLNRMADRGVRFTQMYNGARCCPTRASLLTGLYAQQAGVGHMINNRKVGPAYQGYLRDDCVTLGEAMQLGGYKTLYCGKWHASPGIPIIGAPVAQPGEPGNPYPLSRGFDRFWGTLAGCGNFFYPHALMDQDRPIRVEDEGFYYTDAIGEKSCEMIESAVSEERPFLLHVCYTAPHWPLHARPEDIEKYRGTYRRGWDHFRTARYEEMKRQGILDASWEISPRDTDSRDYADDSPARQEWEDLRMAVYAAQVESMDRSVGTILDKLTEHGIEDNTLVMFMSDNGGCAEFLNEDGDNRSWPGMYARAVPEGMDCTVGNIEGLEPGGPDTYMSYDLPWANVSNTPFRMYKHWVHEGGIGTPLVCQWPDGIEGGRIVHQPCHIIDVMATCLELAGINYPGEYKGEAIQPLEGESLVPLLRGNDRWQRERPLFWEHEGNCAVRDGQWKLVSKTVDGRNGPWELYDMLADRTELNDLADREPERLRRMVAMYKEWTARCGVLPWNRGPVQAG